MAVVVADGLVDYHIVLNGSLETRGLQSDRAAEGEGRPCVASHSVGKKRR